jgi:hypothetical protein
VAAKRPAPPEKPLVILGGSLPRPEQRKDADGDAAGTVWIIGARVGSVKPVVSDQCSVIRRKLQTSGK